jgi:RNA methyltransferase, TrmH family
VTPGEWLGQQRILALRERSVRDAEGVAVVEGGRFAMRALQSGAAVLGAVVARELLGKSFGARLSSRLALERVPVRRVGAAEYRVLSLAAEPQGILLIVRQRWTPLPEGVSRRRDLWVGVERVHAPGNLGTVLRTLVAAGARGLVCIGPDADPYDSRCVRGTMGAIFDLELVRTTHAELSSWCRRSRVFVVGSSAHALRDYRSVSYRRPALLMLGCERGGLSEAQHELCDKVVKIPIRGPVDSLNVAVAAGVWLYEVVAQRHPPARSARRIP